MTSADRLIEPKPIGSAGPLGRLLPFVLAHRRDVGLAFGAAIGGQVASAAIPAVQRIVIDDAVVNHRISPTPWLALMVIGACFSFGCAYIRRWVGGRVSLEVQFDIRNAIFERLQRLDFAGHDKLQTGQLVSRASSDLGLLQTLLGFLPIVTGNVVLLVVAFAIMAYLSPLLTVATLASLPVLLWLSLRMRSSVFPATWHAQQRAGEVAGVVDEAVAGVRVVKGFGQEQREQERLAQAARNLYSSRRRLIGIQALYGAAINAVPLLAQAGVLALGGWLAIKGRITIGTFLAFSSYLVQMVPPVRQMSVLFAASQQAKAGAERILDVLDATPIVADRVGAVDLRVEKGEVEFRNVRFGYSLSRPVLDGFTLKVAGGETVALVGTSGSGKSTVAALLPRFYDVNNGQISVDGQEISSVTMHSLRASIGVAFEDAFLFSDSVRANIAYAHPDATQEEVAQAAAAAGATSFIVALPHGYDTVVGERGVTLSGGQRQRIALARAILGAPSVLVLDDATSSVDVATEEAIHETLRSLLVGRTTILIAHRLSTVRLADRIVVVDEGRVIAEGSHEALMASNELYRALFDSELTDGQPVHALAPTPADRIGAQPTAPTSIASTVTPSAWPSPLGSTPVAMLNSAAVPSQGPPGGGRGGGSGSMSISATPQLLEKLSRLKPATALPKVDDTEAAKTPASRFNIMDYLRRWRVPLAVTLVLLVVDSVATLLGPLLIRRGLDHGVATKNVHVLFSIAALFCAVTLTDALITLGYTLLSGTTAETVLYSMRLMIFAQLQRLSLDYYDAELDGRIMTRMTTDVEALSQLIQTGLVTAVVGALSCIGMFVFLLVLSVPLALITTAIIPPIVLATVLYQRRAKRAYNAARDAIANVNANLQESLAGVRLAQASGRQDRNISGFSTVNRSYRDARLGTQRLISIYFPFINFLGDLSAVLVLAAGAWMARGGTVTPGVVVAFVLYLDLFFAPIQQLSQVFDTWQQATVSISRIGQLMDTPVATPVLDNALKLDQVRGRVSFESVSFRYVEGVRNALTEASFEVEPGETVAFVGETGAGKSTIVKLVARYFDPSSGRILIDGHNLADLDLSSYRRHLGVVPQEAFLFTGTIGDNIAYGRDDATDLEVESAARSVGAHDFIAGLQFGYNTHVTERGRSLSSGQRQMIALSRALLVDPSILLLDEATSQLDLATEAQVGHAIGRAARGRTTLVVAHRLTTAAAADRIVVVDDGRIAEVGTHDELMSCDGAYARLWRSFTGSDTAQ